MTNKINTLKENLTSNMPITIPFEISNVMDKFFHRKQSEKQEIKTKD